MVSAIRCRYSMRMRKRGLGSRGVITVVFVACGVAAPLRAQTDVEHPPVAASGVASPTLSEAGEPPVALAAIDFSRQVIQQPAGPPPTPRHTGIKAMLKGLVIDLKYLPSRENLFWAGVG